MSATWSISTQSAMVADQNDATRMPFSMHPMHMATVAAMAAMATPANANIMRTDVITSVSLSGLIIVLPGRLSGLLSLILSGLTGLISLVGLTEELDSDTVRGD